jgi:hypothetical protein
MTVWHATFKEKSGVMEYWSTGVLEQFVIRSIHFIDPLLHYSITPLVYLGER